MRVIRLTLIIAGSFLIIAVGIGYLLLRAPNETNTNTNGSTALTNTTNQQEDVNGNVTDEPEATPPTADASSAVKASAIIFAERFKSYNESNREAVLPSILPYITSANAARLEQDAARLARLPDPLVPRIHDAQVISVAILNQASDRATVDVTLRITISSGMPPEQEGVEEQTVRLLMVQENMTWKVENATL